MHRSSGRRRPRPVATAAVSAAALGLMRIDDTVGPDTDPALKGLVVVFNATPQTTTRTVAGTAGAAYVLDPAQAGGSDPVVKTSSHSAANGTFTVPARTVAVFRTS
ncbi:hypothetical protein KNE206_41610 [Kitasatospora sp. NE20-6]|uniref:alpha-1,6-glucosidase domain-containing protein n=1 Tax=Kitasatospora sp. NE20-6 TaxID=2859066 RepID=UPI0034DBBEA6